MESRNEINEMVARYLEQFQNEDHQDLVDFINNNELLFDRKNFEGHITASAFIMDADGQQLLLLKHKLYDRYLQPGGHVEQDDFSILAAALREAIEETGIKKEELLHVPFNMPSLPMDIDSHHIPANPSKNEPAHVHHDFRYLFIYNGNKNIAVPLNESKGAKWINFFELQTGIFSTIAEKIKNFSADC